jgi:FkbM family methyltransferase
MLYEQNTEVDLLRQLLVVLDDRTVIDVGAERGFLTQEFLDAGAQQIYAFEPYPANVIALRDKYSNTPAVQLFDLALGLYDEAVMLYIAQDKDGHTLDSFHSVIAASDTPLIHWAGELSVQCRSLESLVKEGAIPARVGILKIDTEGNDFAILRGMGSLQCSVVMIEYWNDLSETVASCPYHLNEVVAFMMERGYSNFAFIKRWDEFECIQLNNTEDRSGEWGNVLFIHDSEAARLMPVLYQAAADAQVKLFDKAQMFKGEAAARLDVIEALTGQIGTARPDVIEALTVQIEALTGQIGAAARLDVIEALTGQIGALAGQIGALTDQIGAFRVQSENVPSPPVEEVPPLPEPRLPLSLRLMRRLMPDSRLGSLTQYPPRPLNLPPHYAKTVSSVSPVPCISIVTPSYNQGGFLERTMQSILQQNYPALQYVVMDGGSQDESIDILNKFQNQLAYSESRKDDGQANAINNGFAHTTGEIMAYLNSDDLLLPGSLNYVAEYFATHPDVDVVYGHRVLINETDQQIGHWVLPHHSDSVLSWADYIPQETLFWRRRIWDKVGGTIDESFHFAVDWDLIIRFRDAGAKFVRLPRFLGAFRVHSQQKTSARLHDMGQMEMFRLREKCAGRPVTQDEVRRRIFTYKCWSLLYERLYHTGILRY